MIDQDPGTTTLFLDDGCNKRGISMRISTVYVELFLEK